jgi:hypothetical protein
MTSAAIPLSRLRPLELKTAAEVDELLRGFLAFDTLAIRSDVSMEDACDVLAASLRQLHSLLQVLDADADARDALGHAVGAAVSLVSVARIHAEVICAGVWCAVAPVGLQATGTEVRRD